MKYAIFGNINKEEIKQKLSGFCYDEDNPEIVLSFGGDGTVLGAVRKYINKLPSVKFLGINTGRLGFYTDFELDELDDIISLLKNDYQTTNFSLLEYELKSNKDVYCGLALNEIAITNPIHTQNIDVYIDSLLFETFRGTGLIISTPSGSTAYNKSLGGSVIDPTINAIQLTEMASINNRVYKTLSSPIVLSSDTTIKLKSNDYSNLYISVDGNYLEFSNLTIIEAKMSKSYATFIIKENRNFWDRVKKAFL